MANNLTGVEYLGCIYDIYGYYARANSVNTAKRLFNLPDADAQITIQGEQYSYPKDAIGAPAVSYEAREVFSSSESTEDLYAEMSVSAKLSGSYGLFSSEVDAKYDSSYTSSSYYYHVEKSGYVNSYKLTLDLDYAMNNLDEDFKNALYNMNAKDLVAKYGTHFLYEAIFGGRWSYSQSISKFNYSSSDEAKLQVQANYDSYSADISGSSQTDHSQSSSQSNGKFWCLGGTPETLTEGFEAWSATLSGNFVLVNFTDYSLKRISELVEGDENRKDEIDDAIDAALKLGQNPSTTYLTTTSANQETWSTAKKNETFELDSNIYFNKDGYIIVGFGGRVNNNGDFTRIAVCYLDLSTSKRQWEVFGDKTTFDPDDYEALGEVPEGCVLTGIGLKGSNDSLQKMVLYYQEIALASSTYNYLDNNLQSIAFKGQKEVNPDDNYEVHFNPGDYNDMVITNIGVNYRKDKKKKENKGGDKVNRLKLYRNQLVEIVVEGATYTEDNSGSGDNSGTEDNTGTPEEETAIA